MCIRDVQFEVTLISAMQLVREPLDHRFDVELHRSRAAVVRVASLDVGKTPKSMYIVSIGSKSDHGEKEVRKELTGRR